MVKRQIGGMQGLPGKDLEAVVDELPVLGKGGSSQDLIPSIFRVIEKRVADMPEVGPDLMGTARFKPAFHQGDITESFNHAVVRYGLLPV